MKYILSLIIGFSFITSASAVETKKVCHTFKGKQQCKVVKLHKKFDNAKVVPTKRKK